MRILVTGAAGYIGSIIARDLAAHHQVRGLDLHPMPDLPDHRVVDLNSYEDISASLEGIDGIAHLAWPMRQHADAAPGEHTDLGVGVRSVYFLLMAAVEHGIRRVVFQSTINITAPSWDNWRLTEEELPRPGVGGYSLGKTLAEEMCRSFARLHDITIAVIRFGGVPTLELPGREGAAPDQHGVPSSCAERRDIAQAYHLALTRPLPSRFEIFHIFHARPGQRFPIDKARDILGFEPVYNYEHMWHRCTRRPR